MSLWLFLRFVTEKKLKQNIYHNLKDLIGETNSLLCGDSFRTVEFLYIQLAAITFDVDLFPS